MASKLDFSPLDDTREERPSPSARSRRWGRREANPTVQMSVRMKEDVYEKFRLLAEQERYTNGEMMELMLEHYLTCPKAKGK